MPPFAGWRWPRAPVLAEAHPPNVTALLTLADPRRLRRARARVDQFLAQTYARKQLVVANSCGTPVLTRDHPDIEELAAPEGLPGTLHNLALAHATGDWICTWDDDTYQDPHRLAYQMAHRVPGRANLLTAQVRVNLDRVTACAYSRSAGLPGTLLFPRGDDRYTVDATPESEVDLDAEFFARCWRDRADALPNQRYPANMLTVAFQDVLSTRTVGQFLGSYHDDAYKGRSLLDPDASDHLAAVLRDSGFEVVMARELPEVAEA